MCLSWGSDCDHDNAAKSDAESFGFHREEQLKAVFSYTESHSSLSEVKVNPAPPLLFCLESCKMSRAVTIFPL